MAEFQTFVQNLPEFTHISFCGTGNIYQVDGNNALIESSVEFVAAVSIALGIFHSQEGAASHTRINLAFFQLSHDLSGNVIRYHTFGGTFCSQFCQMPVFGIFGYIIFIQYIDQFRECRGDPGTFFVFYALKSLKQCFFDDHGKVFTNLTFRNFVQIHKHGDERSLSVTGHQSDELILDRLDSALYFVAEAALGNLVDDGLIQSFSTFFSFFNHFGTQFLTTDIHKWCQMCQSKGLTAVLVTCNLCHNLCGNVAGGEEAVRLLDHGLADDGTILQHVFQIDQIAVVLFLCIIIGIVEMDDSFFMRTYDLFRKKDTHGKIFADLTCHIISLSRVDGRILIGIFLFYVFIDLV